MTDFYDDPVHVTEDDSRGFGPVFPAGRHGECSACAEGIQVDDDIRADGLGGWIHARESCEMSVEWALSGQASVPPQRNSCLSCFCVHAGECL